MLLHKGIQTDNRQTAEYDDGVFQHLNQRGALALVGGNHIGHFLESLGRADDVAQDHLECELGFGAQVNVSVKISVPVSHGIVKGQHRQNGLGKGKDQLEQNLDVVCPVQAGGLQHFLRNAVLEVGAGNDHVVNRNGPRQNQRPHGVQQVQAADIQIGRDQGSGKDHGKDEQSGDHVASHEPADRQGIGGHNRHDNVDDRSHNGIDDGVAVPQKEHPGLEYLGVSVQVEAHRPYSHLTGDYCVGSR